jgi:hypothetical protein
MSATQAPTSILKKDGLPMGGLSYEADYESNVIDTESVTRPNGLEVRSLKSLSVEDIDMLLGTQEHVKAEITRSFAEQAIPPGIYKDDGQTYWVCPRALFKEDDNVGAMLYTFSKMAGATIKTIETPAEYTRVYDEKFIDGLWFGMESSTNQKRRRAKQSYELGRTCTFALIVKNVFETTVELGTRALIKDHFFYGNNAGETINKAPALFCIKTKLRSFFSDPAIGDLIYGITNYTAAAVGFSYLTESEQNKVISENLVPIDQLITSCYTTVTVKRGRGEVKQTRKPNPIRSSPLFLKEEMELLSLVSNLIFADLNVLSENYETAVFDRGFDVLERQIRDSIRVRWETLQRFANRTKIRLQDIRKLSNNPTLRKAGVTQDHVNLLLTTIQNPVERLVSEVLHIIGNKDLRDIIAYAFNKKFPTVKDARLYLTFKVFNIYQQVGLKNTNLKTFVVEKPSQEPSEIEFTRSLETFSKLSYRSGDLKKHTLGLTTIKPFKLLGRLQAIEGMYNNAMNDLHSLSRCDKASRDSAVSFYSEGREIDSDDYLEVLSKSFKDSLSKALIALRTRASGEADVRITNPITGFLQKFADLGVFPKID